MMGVEPTRPWCGGDEGGAAFVLDPIADSAGGSSISSSSSSSLSDDVSVSLSVSSLLVAWRSAARDATADGSSESSSLSDVSGVGEWLRKRAGRRETAGEERTDAAALLERDFGTLSSTAVL